MNVFRAALSSDFLRNNAELSTILIYLKIEKIIASVH